MRDVMAGEAPNIQSVEYPESNGLSTGIHRDTLGLYVVNLIEDNMSDPNNSVGFTAYDDTVSAELWVIRDRLRKLNLGEREIFTGYLRNAMPRFLQDMFDEVSVHEYVEHITESGGVGITNDRLINILQWHKHTITKQQESPELSKAVENQKKIYKRGLSIGKYATWLDWEAAYNAKVFVDEVDVLVGDMLISTILDGAKGFYDYSWPDEVTLRQATGSTETWDGTFRELIDFAVKHEWNHALLGKFKQRWLNEAVTEHLSQVFDSGQLRFIDPNDRQKPIGTYISERKILAHILSKGAYIIPARNVTRAYSAAMNGDDAIYERRVYKLYKLIDKSWGVDNTVQKIEDKINEIAVRIAKSKGCSVTQATGDAAYELYSMLATNEQEFFRTCTSDYNNELIAAIS